MPMWFPAAYMNAHNIYALAIQTSDGNENTFTSRLEASNKSHHAGAGAVADADVVPGSVHERTSEHLHTPDILPGLHGPGNALDSLADGQHVLPGQQGILQLGGQSWITTWQSTGWALPRQTGTM